MEAAAAVGRGEPALVFIGFMGAGKTTAARAAAGAMGGRATDSDHLLVERLGMPIEAFFAEHGEAAFRREEEAFVRALLERPPGPVLSLGGGAVTSPAVQAALVRHTVVLLDVDTETAWRRAGGRRRPLARDRATFAALHAERSALYERLADAILDDSSRDLVRRALPHLRALAAAPAGTRLVWARTASRDYPVLVGEGVLGGVPAPAHGRARAPGRRRARPGRPAPGSRARRCGPRRASCPPARARARADAAARGG